MQEKNDFFIYFFLITAFRHIHMWALLQGNLFENKTEPAFTCVRGACDNHTTVCICFSQGVSIVWILTLREQGPLGNRFVSGVVKSDFSPLHKERLPL